MPDNILDGQGATLLVAIVIVAVALLALVGVFWLIRRRSSSTFVRGGRGRQPRLAVLDAAAVDTRRRIVLIRRDDVEHLVMIGGPTDVVIESRIVQARGKPAEPAAQAVEADSRPVAAAQMPKPVPMTAPPHAPDRRTAKPAAQTGPQSQRAAPAPAAAAAAAHRTGPRETAAPAPSRQSAVAADMTTAGSVGTMRAETADILESARARVFEEPRIDTPASEVAKSTPVAASGPASPSQAPPAPDPVTAPGYSEVLADRAATTPSRGAGEPPASDFEAVLAAELSDDLSIDEFDDGFLDPVNQDISLLPGGEPARAPEVEPDTPPSRKSLEAEMERLLGDLSRKPS